MFVQQHYGAKEGPKRFHFGAAGNGEPTDVPLDQQDYREGRALSEFVKFSVGASGHRNQDHTMLVLWGHAYDFAFGGCSRPAAI